MRTVFLFSGLGSQHFHMGFPLYQGNGTFRRSMNRMDAIVQALAGRSIVATLYGGNSKAEPFGDLALASPAIFMVQVALAETLMTAGVMPDLTLGASLGSYAASVAAGCISSEVALELVVRQARIFAETCEPGGMIAVLAEHRLFNAIPLRNNAVIAGTHLPSHFVVSARDAYLTGIEAFLRAEGSPFQRLLVSYPFHSPWIEDARKPLLASIGARVTFAASHLPIVCCASAEVLTTLPADHFWNAAREPIQFQQSIMKLELEGPFQYIDLGPSSSLAAFLKYLLPAATASRAYPVMTPFDQDLSNLSTVLELRR